MNPTGPREINPLTASARTLWCVASANLLSTWRQVAAKVGLPSTPENTWIDAVILDMVDRAVTNLPPYPSPQAWREACELKHWCARWNAYGAPVYDLTHSLAAALVLTDCSEVRGEEMRWTFPSVLIEIPNRNGPLTFYDPTNTRVLEGRYILAHRLMSPVGEGLQAAIETMERAMDMPLGAFLRSLPEIRQEIMKSVRLEPRTLIHLLDERGQGVHMEDVEPTATESLERWLTCTESPPGRSAHLRSGLDQDLDIQALRAASRLLANLFLYLSGQQAEGTLPLPTGRDRPCGACDTVEWPTTWTIGREVKLPRELRMAAREYAARGRSESNRAQWRLRSRHSVCGHWRNQACGPHHSERRRTWISPYWKGPDASEAIGKVYVTDLAGNQRTS